MNVSGGGIEEIDMSNTVKENEEPVVKSAVQELLEKSRENEGAKNMCESLFKKTMIAFVEEMLTMKQSFDKEMKIVHSILKKSLNSIMANSYKEKKEVKTLLYTIYLKLFHPILKLIIQIIKLFK